MRLETAIALALACGGWVCDNGDNLCVGANTCEVDVAKVCCPYDQRYWCDGACFATPDCNYDDAVYACRDEASSSCTFSATISSVACVGAGINGYFQFQASGTATGCGDEGIYIARTDGGAYGGLDCGDWTPGPFHSSCLPTGDTTSWVVDDGPFLVLGSAGVTFTVMTGAGDTLATMTAFCN